MAIDLLAERKDVGSEPVDLLAGPVDLLADKSQPTDLLQQEKPDFIGAGLEGIKGIGEDSFRKLQMINKGLGAVEEPVRKIADETGKLAFERPFGALKAAFAGKNPIEGFAKPEEQEEIGASIVQAWDIKDPLIGTMVGGTLGTMANLAAIHLMYGALPRERRTYGLKVRNKAWNGFTKELKDEFKAFGMDNKTAHEAANMASMDLIKDKSFGQKSTWRIKKATNILRKNKGFWADKMNQMKQAAQQEAGVDATHAARTAPFTEPRIAPGETPKLAEPDIIPYEKHLEGVDILNRQVGPEYDIPLHPAEAGIAAGKQLELDTPELEPTTWFGKKIKESMVDKFNIPIHDKVAFEQGMDEYMTKYGVTPWAEEGGGNIEMPIGKDSSISYLDTEMDEISLRIASKYPEKITDQKSLLKFARNVEEELGVKPNMLTYKFKIVPTQSGHSGRHKRSGRDTGDILIRKGGRKASQKGSYIGMIMPPNQQLGSEGMLKKVW